MILSMRTLYPLKSLNMISTLAFKCMYIITSKNPQKFAVDIEFKGIFGEGFQISTNQNRESTASSFRMKFGTLRSFP